MNCLPAFLAYSASDFAAPRDEGFFTQAGCLKRGLPGDYEDHTGPAAGARFLGVRAAEHFVRGNLQTHV